MIIGIGIDIIEIARIQHAIVRYGSHFLQRLFTAQEIAYCQKRTHAAIHFAARFCAKEAVVKALGTGFQGGIRWLDIEVVNDSEGKPLIRLSSSLRKLFSDPEFLISLSHSKEYATAVAIWQK